MKRFVTLALASALALSLGSLGAACRTQHLGPNTGESYRNAFEDQHAGEAGDDDQVLTAEDAKNVMRAHNATDGKKGASGKAYSAPIALPLGSSTSGGGGGGGGQWQGAQGNIQLEAK